ncbi:MAG: proton-conducting transporter membrane subunit, partial [Xanthobacteraceae bacterium]
MSNDLLIAAFLTWLTAAVISLTGRGLFLARALLFFGSFAGIVAAVLVVPNGTPAVTLPTTLAGARVLFQITPDGLWLLGFGLVPAALAGALATPALQGRPGWLFGAAMSLIGALGVFGIRDGAGFLIAWEIMSFGGAVMILSEKLSSDAGRPVLFMLSLLEVGTIALVVAVLVLAVAGHSFAFETYRAAGGNLAVTTLCAVGVLLLIGFGAKLGLLPFYEWFPAAYGSG